MGRKHVVIDRNFDIREKTRTVWHMVRTALRYLVATVSLAITYYVIFALVVSTDSEKILRNENRLYQRNYAEMVRREHLIADVIRNVQMKDDAIYDDIFHAKAPSMNPLMDEDYMSAVDSIPDRLVVDYAKQKLDSVSVSADRVEENFRRILALASGLGEGVPPMSIPLESLSYAQVGATIGNKVNPFYKVGSEHNGLDLIAPQGDAVIASGDGVVSNVIRSRKGMGNVVELKHDGGYLTRYAHLGDVYVTKGQKVSRGKKLGTVGISGNTFAPHLHYEVLKDSTRLDPVDFFFASTRPDDYVNMKLMASRTGQSLD